MNKKRLFFLPIAFVIGTAIASCASNGGFNSGDYNTVTITFDATNSGYFPDSANPDSRDEVLVKEVRYGISWSKLIKGIEIPNEPICNKLGYSFSYYKLGDTKVDPAYKITSDIAVTAVYETDGHKFCYDPWETVIAHANNGYEDLAKYYYNDYEANKESFIGLERELKYGNSSYKVRVIGEKSDDLAEESDKVATLTFEFSELLPGFAYDSNDTSHYEDCSLRKALNGRVKNNIEEIVRNNIKKVKKYTNEGNGISGREHIITTEDFVFIPSMYEMGILNDENGDTTEREGYTYTYYSKHNTVNDRKKAYRNRSGDMVEANYWTRSPDATVDSAVWPIDSNGHTGIEDAGSYNTIDPSVALGISPCFGIGVSTISPEDRIRFETDSWDNIVVTANKGFNALKERYKLDMADNNDSFIGLTHPITIKTKNESFQYNVRVIGEKHDYFNDSRGNKHVTPLTFQFTSVVGQKEDMYVQGFVNENAPSWIILTQNNNWHYQNSMVDLCLNNNIGGDQSKMDKTWGNVSGNKTLVEMIDDTNLREALRPVRKTSWCATGINTVTKETDSYKMFPLSYNEYGAYQQNYSSYGKNFDSLIKDDSEKPYEYYDYNRVTNKSTKEEKFKEIERRRGEFNDVTEAYEPQTKSGVTCNVPVLDRDNTGSTKWAHSYLRSINMVRFERVFIGNYDQKYAMLHPNGEANDWAGMTIVNSTNGYCQNHTNYRIGVVPAFSIGQD